MSVLRYFITSKAKRNILKLFLSHIDSAFYTREVARLTGEPLNAVRRELGYLEKAGLLRSYTQGNLKYYQVIRQFPVLSEWQKIILFTPNIESGGNISTTDDKYLETKSQSANADLKPIEYISEVASFPSIGEVNKQKILDMLKNKLAPLGSVTLALVYGPAALEDVVPEEGIDLLVVGDIDKESLLALLSDIEDNTSVPINAVRMTRSDFDYRSAKGDPFIRKIWSEKKLVIKGRH